MKYVKFTKIDSETGISTNIQRARNGEVYPLLTGLSVIFQDQNITEFWYGTANDSVVVDNNNQSWIITKEQFTTALTSTVDKIKVRLLSELSNVDKAIRDELLGVYHTTALLAGTYKVEQAKAFIAGNPDPQDALHLEASTRGVTVEYLAGKVLEKYNSYIYIDALIAAIRGKLEDRIETFTVDVNNPITSWNDFLSLEDIGNGTMLAKYGTDIYGRMIPLLSLGV